MDPLIQIVVLIAASLYIADRFSEWFVVMQSTHVKLAFAELHELHRTTFEKIQPSFELWWGQGPEQQVSAKITDEIKRSVPEGMIGIDLPEPLIKMITSDLSDQVKRRAMHLATHAVIDTQTQLMLAKLSRKKLGREMANEWEKDHEQVIEDDSTTLLEYGVDVDALQHHFANTPAS